MSRAVVTVIEPFSDQRVVVPFRAAREGDDRILRRVLAPADPHAPGEVITGVDNRDCELAGDSAALDRG